VRSVYGEEPVPGNETLVVSERVTAGPVVLVAQGVLNSSTYRKLRDTIIKAALDHPDGVIVDITALAVPAASALTVFTSVRWHLSEWSSAPLALVCGHPARQKELARNAITRYVPVFPTVESATAAPLSSVEFGTRRRTRAVLPAVNASVARSRQLVAEWLTAWSLSEFIPVAKMIVTVFMENVLAHTDYAPGLRVESNGFTVTVAVEDGSSVLASRREKPCGIGRVAGLAVVAAMSRRWGNSPTPGGKTVWAVIGPENCI
jgi:hypothetical protein